MTTMYLVLEAYPSPNGISYPGLNAQIFLASKFLNPPVGYTRPPGTPDGTANGVAVSITGLDVFETYYVLLFNPQGYQHWFKADWSTGKSADDPLVLGVPMNEGVIAGNSLTMGPLAQFTGSS